MKWTKVVTLLIIVSYSYGQNTKLFIELPVLSYDINSHPNLKDGLNSYYFNKIYIPNLRIGINRKLLYIGIETYSNVIHNLDYPISLGDIIWSSIDSYSLLIGLEKEIEKISARLNVGLTYNDSSLGVYRSSSIHDWELKLCYGFNPIGPLISTNLKYEVFKKFNLRLNVRLNPMLRSFQRSRYSCPLDFLDHDRIHYMIAQLAIGYDINL